MSYIDHYSSTLTFEGTFNVEESVSKEDIFSDGDGQFVFVNSQAKFRHSTDSSHGFQQLSA